MKTNLLLIVLVISVCFCGFAQSGSKTISKTISSGDKSLLNKPAGYDKKYDPSFVKALEESNKAAMNAGEGNIKHSKVILPTPMSNASCSCDIPIDSTWNVVPFDGCCGCSGCPGVPPDYRNDDGFTGTQVYLPFG